MRSVKGLGKTKLKKYRKTYLSMNYNSDRSRRYGKRIGDIVSLRANSGEEIYGRVFSFSALDNNRMDVELLSGKVLEDEVAEWWDVRFKVEDLILKLSDFKIGQELTLLPTKETNFRVIKTRIVGFSKTTPRVEYKDSLICHFDVMEVYQGLLKDLLKSWKNWTDITKEEWTFK